MLAKWLPQGLECHSASLAKTESHFLVWCRVVSGVEDGVITGAVIGEYSLKVGAGNEEVTVGAAAFCTTLAVWYWAARCRFFSLWAGPRWRGFTFGIGKVGLGWGHWVDTYWKYFTPAPRWRRGQISGMSQESDFWFKDSWQMALSTVFAFVKYEQNYQPNWYWSKNRNDIGIF